MSKKQPASKRQQRMETATVPVLPGKQSTVREGSARQRPQGMLHFLLLFTSIMPFFFSVELMDSNLVVRYGFMAGFVLLFILYFYGIRRKQVFLYVPLQVKRVFFFVFAFGIWSLVSFFTAPNFQNALYGTARYWLLALFLFVVAQVAAEEEPFLHRLARLLSVAAIIHTFIGLGQYYGAAFLDIPGNYVPYGLMANRNLFGSAQVMLLPFAIYTLYQGSRPWKYLAGLAITGIIISAILSQTRSSWLAAMASVMLGGVLVSVYARDLRRKWLLGIAIGFASAVALFFLFIQTDSEGELSRSLRERTSTFVHTDTTMTGNAASDNIAERLKIWSKTSELIRDNWLTGVGQENWRVVVTKYGTTGLAWEDGKVVPDNPHNDYLLVIAESGIPGFLLYLGTWLMIALTAFKTIRNTKDGNRRVLNCLMLGGLAGLAVDALFSFPMERMEHMLYLFLMAGTILGTAVNEGKQDGQKTAMKTWLLGIFTAIAMFNLFLAIKKYNFEKHLLRAKLYQESGRYAEAIEEAGKGKTVFASLSPNGSPIENFSGIAHKELNQFPEAMRDFRKGLKYHPYNKTLYVNLGTVYTSLGKYDSAIGYYNKALELTPKYDVIFFNLAINYFILKDYRKCLEMLGKTDIGNNTSLRSIKMQAESFLAQGAAGNTPVK